MSPDEFDLFSTYSYLFGNKRVKSKLRVLSLLRNRLLTRGLCQILVDLSPIVGVSWEFYFVCSFLPWDLGCAHFVDFTYGLYEITAARPAPPGPLNIGDGPR